MVDWNSPTWGQNEVHVDPTGSFLPEKQDLEG